MAFEHTAIHNAKAALLDIREYLPVIPGRDGSVEFNTEFCNDFPVYETPQDTITGIDLIPFKAEGIREYVGEFVEKAHSMAVDGLLLRLSGYCGIVGATGQLLDFFHSDDGITVRKIVTIADRECQFNPSTEVANLLGNDPNVAATLKGLDKRDYDEIPKSVFQKQVPEGQFATVGNGQFHSERTLSIGTAKLALIATYKYRN